eukprot:1156725-Pelagomonas_calceolata.AAC.1
MPRRSNIQLSLQVRCTTQPAPRMPCTSSFQLSLQKCLLIGQKCFLNGVNYPLDSQMCMPCKKVMHAYILRMSYENHRHCALYLTRQCCTVLHATVIS